MVTYILMALLAVTFVAVIILDIFKEKARREEVNNLMDRIDWMEDQNDHLNKEIAEVNLKFSGSLDTRAKNYDDIFMKLKKVEIELEKSEMECERLRARIAVLESQKETENEQST